MSRWLALLPLIALVAMGLLFGLYSLNRNPQVQPDALVGQPAEGTPTPVRQALGGEVALVNFFASWCAPCEVEHPTLMALKGRGVKIVGVAYKDAPPQTQAFLTRLGDPFATRLVDRDGAAGIEFGVTGVPETYLVGADGVILAKHTGPLTVEDAEALLARVE